MATDKQIAFASRLIAERGETARAYASIDLAALSTWDASRVIDELLALPVAAIVTAASVPSARPDVGEGRYAVTLPAPWGVMFVRVDRPTEGKWRGYTFVSRVVGGRDRGVRIPRDCEARALEQIASDPAEAMARFGRETGTCGQCGRTLTDPVSVAFGIGPDCADRLGISRVNGQPVATMALAM